MTNVGTKVWDFISALRNKVAEIADFEEVEIGSKATIDKTIAAYILPTDSTIDIVSTEHNKISIGCDIMIYVRSDGVEKAFELFQKVYDKLAEDRTLGGKCEDLVFEGFTPEVTRGTYVETRFILHVHGWIVC